ncbi:MAG: peptidoglycan bridge formation glycyltransferase FemA/FemB family protein, partial [Erysipelotrichaceae bacterium]
HWEMMNYGMKNNYQRYNLYGISGIFDSSAPDFGVYEFKRGFQGEVVELLGTFTFIPNPVLWNSYRTLRRIKHTLSK